MFRLCHGVRALPTGPTAHVGARRRGILHAAPSRVLQRAVPAGCFAGQASGGRRTFGWASGPHSQGPDQQSRRALVWVLAWSGGGAQHSRGTDDQVYSRSQPGAAALHSVGFTPLRRPREQPLPSTVGDRNSHAHAARGRLKARGLLLNSAAPGRDGVAYATLLRRRGAPGALLRLSAAGRP